MEKATMSDIFSLLGKLNIKKSILYPELYRNYFEEVPIFAQNAGYLDSYLCRFKEAETEKELANGQEYAILSRGYNTYEDIKTIEDLPDIHKASKYPFGYESIYIHQNDEGDLSFRYERIPLVWYNFGWNVQCVESNNLYYILEQIKDASFLEDILNVLYKERDISKKFIQDNKLDWLHSKIIDLYRANEKYGLDVNQYIKEDMEFGRDSEDSQPPLE